MKYLIVSLALIVGLACAPKSANLSPEASRLIVADQVVLRLGELGDTAVAANRNGSLAAEPAVKIAKFVKAGVATVTAAPDGWLPALKALWKPLKENLTDAIKAKLGAAWTVLDGWLGGA